MEVQAEPSGALPLICGQTIGLDQHFGGDFPVGTQFTDHRHSERALPVQNLARAGTKLKADIPLQLLSRSIHLDNLD